MGRVDRSPGSDAPLRPFPTVSRQWVAFSHRSFSASLQSRGRLRHHTGFPFTQARYVWRTLRDEFEGVKRRRSSARRQLQLLPQTEPTSPTQIESHEVAQQ